MTQHSSGSLGPRESPRSSGEYRAPPDTIPRSCRECGATFPPGTSRNRKTCHACLRAIKAAAQEKARQRKAQHACIECGTKMPDAALQRKYCGDDCQRRAWQTRERHRLAAQGGMTSAEWYQTMEARPLQPVRTGDREFDRITVREYRSLRWEVNQLILGYAEATGRSVLDLNRGLLRNGFPPRDRMDYAELIVLHDSLTRAVEQPAG